MTARRLLGLFGWTFIVAAASICWVAITADEAWVRGVALGPLLVGAFVLGRGWVLTSK